MTHGCPASRYVALQKCALAVAGVVLLVSACDAQPPRGRTTPNQARQVDSRDWPQWRGPNRDGLSVDTGLLKEWPANGPPIAWRGTGIGEGFSSVSVAGRHVYTMGDLGDTCYVFALDRDNGEIIWKANVGKAGEGGGYRGPRSTPTVDENRVYALGIFSAI
jgi:outer membrane protein assembly factor BamB